MSRFRPGYDSRARHMRMLRMSSHPMMSLATNIRSVRTYRVPTKPSAVAPTIPTCSKTTTVSGRRNNKTNRMSTGGKPPMLPTKPLRSIRPCFLSAFLRYLRLFEHPLSHHSWEHGPRGLANHTEGGEPVEFTVFGVAEEMDENCVVELIRPDWDDIGSEGQELGIRFDMQLAVIRDIVLAHGLYWEPSDNSIMARLPDNAVPGDITTWTAVVLTCTLAVLEIDDEDTGRAYILDVKKVVCV